MSGVQVRGNLKARPDGKFDDRLAATIGERLIALEKANRDAVGGFVSPGVPAFGAGNPGAPGSPGAPGAPGASGVTDHGGLTGLEDDDHPQYVQREQGPVPHVHGPDDVAGLEQRFLRRGESAPALPHVHTSESLGLDAQFYRRPERVPAQPHSHVMAEVADFRPDDAQFILASRVFGG